MVLAFVAEVSIRIGRPKVMTMSEISLEQLVDELVSLSDENLARRVIETSDVQWCLSELQDILAADVAPSPQWIKCEDKLLPFVEDVLLFF